MNEDEFVEDIKEIKKWSRLQGLESLKNVLEGFSRGELVIYDEADGETSNQAIADAADVSEGMVSERLQDWGEMHIVEKDGRQWKHIAPLSAMGLEIPEGEEDG